MGPISMTQTNPSHEPIRSMSKCVTYIDDSIDSYSQRAVTGAPKGTPASQKSSGAKLMGDKIYLVNKCVAVYI